MPKFFGQMQAKERTLGEDVKACLRLAFDRFFCKLAPTMFKEPKKARKFDESE